MYISYVPGKVLSPLDICIQLSRMFTLCCGYCCPYLQKNKLKFKEFSNNK